MGALPREHLHNFNVEIDAFLNELDEGVLNCIRKNRLKLTNNLESILRQNIDLEEYYKLRNELLIENKNLSNVETIVSELRESRFVLISKGKEFKKNVETNGICLLCGHDWSEVEEYYTKVEEQTVSLERHLSKSAEELDFKVNLFTEKYLARFKEAFIHFKNENVIDYSFFQKLKKTCSIEEKQKILELIKILNDVEIEFDNLLNTSFSVPQNLNLEPFLTIIEKAKEQTDGIKSYFDEVFLRFFKNDSNALDRLVIDQIDEKIGYIKHSFSLYQNVELKKSMAIYESESKKIERSKEIRKSIESVKGTYKKSLEDYQKKVIEDIEILFHIYSGRIFQNSQAGLGLFIINRNGIKFVDNPSKTYDALFNMSSGQLAALIISFTLALNKKYSKNKILLIDDPIQTLDELNIASFIEVLRNDFADRQIVISTHEDMMSAYMRYKFEKYGVNTVRINLRD